MTAAAPSWREAQDTEIRAYYEDEFPAHIEDLPGHVTPNGPKEYGLSFRSPHPICRDGPPRNFVRRSTWQTDEEGSLRRPQLTDWDELLAFVRRPATADIIRGSEYALADPAVVESSEPVPEAFYYRLDHHFRPWVLMVDIDAKDIARTEAEAEITAPEQRSLSEVLTETGVMGAPPDGYPYTFDHVTRAIEYGFEVEAIFEAKLNAEETQVVYSGQGVHVYLLDEDSPHYYDTHSRAAITKMLQWEHGVPVDAPVTTDRMRFGRVPYSLHAEVSRVVQPIASPAFDPVTDAVPPFLSEEVSATP